MDALADLADVAGVSEMRTTRDQNLVLLGVAADKLAALVASVKAIGLDVPDSAEDIPDVISCPGTTTCRIGINNSQSFARQALASANADPLAKGVSIHVSGCQNSCGLHHVADFGLHGMAKKIDGRSAPHYQLHFGGEARTGLVGVPGPIVPAKLADEALTLLRRAYGDARQTGEGVRAWAERLGKSGLAAILKPLDGQSSPDLFIDWGDTNDFPGAPPGKGECAAASGLEELYADLADDALITLDRALAVGNVTRARDAGVDAVIQAARRLLDVRALATEDGIGFDAVVATVHGTYAGNDDVLGALASAVAAKDGELAAFRETVAYLIDTARLVVEAPKVAAEAAIGDIDAILGMAE
jgi:sulfite reductase (ferredoxin)